VGGERGATAWRGGVEAGKVNPAGDRPDGGVQPDAADEVRRDRSGGGDLVCLVEHAGEVPPAQIADQPVDGRRHVRVAEQVVRHEVVGADHRQPAAVVGAQ